jgi:hypothetical protein
MVISCHATRTQIGCKRDALPSHGEGAGEKEDLLIQDGPRRSAAAVLFSITVHGYGMGLAKVGKGLKVSIQSVLRGADSGREGFQDRGWRLKDFIQ